MFTVWSTAPDRHGQVELQMAVSVPGERAHAVAAADAEGTEPAASRSTRSANAA